jgi:putative transposase
MRKSRFTDAHIVGILQEATAGAGVRAVCRRHGIAEKSYYRWKQHYGGMQVAETKRLKAKARLKCCSAPNSATESVAMKAGSR